MPISVGSAANLTSSLGTELNLVGFGTWMNVKSTGILTRPQTPHFAGQLTGLGSAYNPGNGVTLKITADRNSGNCWNNATGQFTCPVAGYYMTAGGGIMAQTSGYLYLYRNGVVMHYTHWSHSGSWHYVPLSGIVQAAAGDTIAWTIEGVTGSGMFAAGGHNMFSIALLE
jgi:hypothetical protein